METKPSEGSRTAVPSTVFGICAVTLHIRVATESEENIIAAVAVGALIIDVG